MLDRRTFMVGLTTGLASACAPRPARTVVEDAFSIWYNRPSALSLGWGRYVVSSVSSKGEAQVSRFGRGTSAGSITLASFDRVSDHGTPAIALADDRVVYAIANHSSALFVGSLDLDNWVDPSDTDAVVLDDGLCTYPSLVWHDDELLLFYTTLHRGGDELTYRDYVMRRSVDGGRTWSEKSVCIPGVERIIPYPVQPFVTRDGRLWIAFSKMVRIDRSKIATEDLFLLYSADGGRSWIDERNGAPAWMARDTTFQVYDACAHDEGIRTISLCADAPWGGDSDPWSRVDAYVINFDLTGGVEMTRIENVSWQQYFNGAIVRRDRPENVLVAEVEDGAEVIAEWKVADGRARRLRTARSPNGLVFPFQADNGAVFAHDNYTGTMTNTFYSDIVLTNL